MTRRFSYGFLMLLAVFAGCRELPAPEEENAIRFGVEEVMVKADFVAPNGADYLIKSGNKTKVYGTRTDGAEKETVFNGETLTCGGSASDWSYETDQYWKKSGTYAFKAVFPIPESLGSSTDGTHLTVSYSMHTTKYDLMVASATRDMAEGYLGPVVLPFRHALSAVRVLFRKGENVAENYSLDYFEFRNLRTVGELILESEELSSDSWHLAPGYRPASIFQWEAADESQRKPLYDTYAQYDGYVWHFCLPQSLAVEEGEEHPAIHFRVRMAGGTTIEDTLDIPETIQGDSYSWEPGKVYTYYIGVTPRTTEVFVSVSKWDAAYVSVDELIFD